MSGPSQGRRSARSSRTVPPEGVDQPTFLLTVDGFQHVKRLRRSTPALGPDDLSAIKAKHFRLDLETGRASDGTTDTFLQPMAPATVAELVSRFQLLQYEDLDYDYDPESHSNFDQAWRVSDFLGRCLCLEEDSLRYRQVPFHDLLWRSGWKIRHPSKSESGLGYQGYWDRTWEVQWILDRQDAADPHVICSLSDSVLRDDESICTSEAWCILYLTLVQQIRHQRHRIIPVTLLSASARQVRIVQGCADGARQTISFGTTPILNVQKNKNQHLREWVLLLAWCMSKPTGDTLK